MALPLPPAPGTSFLQGLENMQQRLQQSRLAMQQRELEKQRMAQQASQFQQQMGMRQQMMPYQIQALQDAHAKSQFDENMRKALGGADIKEVSKTNPILRGWYKHEYGIDPLEPTFQEKETIKAQAKSKADATTGFMTQTQKSYQALEGVLPEIEKLAHPDTFVPGVFSLSPSSKQKYLSKTNSLIEQLMTSMALPKTNESIEKVQQMVTRGTGETVSAYKDRLRDLAEDLKKRQKLLGSSLEQKTAMPKSDNILRFNERGELI